ncbi:MAG: hypothetical protein CFE29_02995 [Bradyrhizobiaceae bacterium PARB1]|jgi:hypothetical protein|nr:MAG: hypothetical protein CFE29_02995 [Bradyrhizobiaceae bacterium PARB1]
MKIIAIGVAATLSAIAPSIAQQKAQTFQQILEMMAGTTAVLAYPQFADGQLGSCLIEFSAITQDNVYRQGAYSKFFGSFGVMQAKGNLAVTLKVVVHDINIKTGEFKPNSPANSYFIFGAQSSKAELVGNYPSDTPGAQFSVFRPLPTFEKLSEALDKGVVSVAFNRKDGGMDLIVPIDVTVVSTSDTGKRSHSSKMVDDFYKCSAELAKAARAGASN